jgi:hypothetical protein
VTLLALLPAVAPAQQPPPPPGPAAAPIPPLRGELATLRARVDEIEKHLAEARAQKAHLRDIESLLLRVQEQLDSIEASGAPGRDDAARRELDAIRARLDDLRERVGHLEFEAGRRREAGFGADPEGPVVRSSDGAFAIGLGALLKFRAELSVPDPGRSEVGFALPIAKMILDGHAFTPALRYRLQTELGEGRNVLQDYFVEYAAILPWATFRFGQFKVPFGRQRSLPVGALQLTDRSVAANHFDHGRDVGAQVAGGWREDRLQWWLGVFNGNGSNTDGNDNQDVSWVGRLAISPWGPVPSSEGDVRGQKRPKVAVGGSVSYNLVPTDIVARTGDPGANDDQDGDGTTDNVEQVAGALEGVAHWRGASLQVEYLRRKDNAGAVALFDTGQVQTHRGFYAQAGYFVIPARFEAAFRVAVSEPHDFGLTADERAQLPDEVRELAMVLSYLRYGHHLKLQGEYAHLRSEGIPAPPTERTEHRVRLQLQVGF